MNKAVERIIITRGCAFLRRHMEIKNSQIKRLREAEARITDFVIASSINGKQPEETVDNMYMIIQDIYGIERNLTT